VFAYHISLRIPQHDSVTDSQLQKFDYLSSPYVRPNQKWECGRLREGKPCIKGPAENGKCHTRTECSPIKREDRWYCARSPLTGGICEDGPNSDGSCCHIISPCSPVRSWRAKRGLLSKWMLSLCLGVAVLMLSHSEMAAFISPGKLVTKHADIGDCQSCHSPFEQGITHWVKTAIALDSGVDDSKLCLNCHVFRDNAQHPHNLSLASLDKLTQEAAPATEAGLYPQLRLGAWLFPEREHQRESLTCASCHREHKNDDSLLTNLSNQQCLICHQAKFDNFSNGHPEFSDFPYARRTKLNFDHVTHVNKHFKEEKYENIADGSCTQCHEPDSNGRKMLVKSFETSCSSCHISQIMGETRSGPRGLAVFAVPGIDVETLQAQGMLIGDWPVQSDADLSQFTELLLSSDGKYVAAKAQLVDIDLLDLSDASIKQLQSVYELAWSVKRLFYDLLTFGTAELKKRLDQQVGNR
jgi:predicted CXXCH cytochrome family protein